jgi:hypothetical protein
MAKVRPGDYLQTVDRACTGQGLNQISRLEFKNRNQNE